MKLVVDNTDISQKQLLKQVQNVCIVYACLAVKRNAGIVSTDAKHAAAGRGYGEISVAAFFRWAWCNGIQFRSWLTIQNMALALRHLLYRQPRSEVDAVAPHPTEENWDSDLPVTSAGSSMLGIGAYDPGVPLHRQTRVHDAHVLDLFQHSCF